MEGNVTDASGNDRVYSFDGGSPGAVSSVVSSPTETCPGSGLSVNEEWRFESVGLKTATYCLPVAPRGGVNEKLTNPKDIVGVRKAPMSTVPANVLAEIGVAMLEGSVKYGRHNYRVAGVRASVYYDAVMRHLMSWWEGEDIDSDSNMNHITKALSCLVVLRDAQMQKMYTDDRPPKAKAFYEELHQKSAIILDKYSDRNPKHYSELD
jgi:hypothetical protein